MKINKKVLIFLSMIMIFFAMSPVYAQDTNIIDDSEKDEATTLFADSINYDNLVEIPKEVVTYMENIYGDNVNVRGWLLHSNDNNEVYSIIIDNEKIGWFILLSDGTVQEFDEKIHSYIFDKTSVISKNLKEALDSSSSDTIKVYIILEDVDHTKIRDKLKNTSSKAYEILFSEAESDKYELSEVQAAISQKRAIYKEEYTLNNNNFLSEISSEVIKGDPFVSEYSPMLIVELSKDSIKTVAEMKNVVTLDLYVEQKCEDELERATELIQADYVRDTLGYDGTGVKIGMFESGSPDTTDSELNSGSITRRYGSANVTDHASGNATIMVGDTLGIANGATLYSTHSYNGSTFYEEIEWLLTQGVNVINMSSKLNDNASYDTESQWVDHIAMNHDVHFVKSAGNNGYGGGYITSPGMAYNAITVGGYNDVNSYYYDDHVIYGGTSWNESSSYFTEKPDLIAPAQNIYLPSFGNVTGTSNSAPMVTATIAQMIDIHSSLATKQTAMKAILLASAFRKIEPSNYGVSGSNFIDEVEGAGCLDSKNARYVVGNYRYESDSKDDDEFTYTTTFYASSSSSQVRVALFWLKQNSMSGDHTSTYNLSQISLGDLDLFIRDPNGNLLSGISSTSSYNNIEVVEFDPTVSGTYTIEVRYYGSNDRESIGLAWW